MRRFRMTQELDLGVEEHWRLFFDPEFERGLYLEHMRFPKYELVEQREDGDKITRRERVTPRLDVPAAVAKVLGPSFGYVEDGTFDKKSRTWRCRILPNVLTDRLSCDMTVTCAELAPERCRRTVETSIDARIFAIGGLVESAFEKSLRDGWENSAGYIVKIARAKRT